MSCFDGASISGYGLDSGQVEIQVKSKKIIFQLSPRGPDEGRRRQQDGDSSNSRGDDSSRRRAGGPFQMNGLADPQIETRAHLFGMDKGDIGGVRVLDHGCFHFLILNRIG